MIWRSGVISRHRVNSGSELLVIDEFQESYNADYNTFTTGSLKNMRHFNGH